MRTFKPRSTIALPAMAAVLALTLSACAGSKVAVDSKPVTELSSLLASPPSSTVAECASPSQLPADAASANVVVRLWHADRSALSACKERHSATVQFYHDRDAALAKR